MANEQIAPARRPAAPKVRSLEDATRVLGEIGRLQARLAQMDTSVEVSIAQARLDHAETVEPIKTAIAQMTDQLRGFCEANRAQLLKGKKGKTIKLTTGDAGWRKVGEKVTVEEGVDLLALLKEHGMGRFIRKKESPDMVALVKDAKAVERLPGVSIDGGDDAFFVKPSVLTQQGAGTQS